MLNLQFYKGSDLYSDGNIENEILAIVKQNKDFTSIWSKDDRWPILYHLAPDRRNLLEWYPFEKDSTLLEIGAGCGALTGLFCEKVTKVTAVELSKKRAEIIEARYENKNNLSIFVGNLMDIAFEEKFDYITLIGVLEYANKFIDSQNPFADLIIKVKQLLKP
ncbi:MAG: class I SAM-dependent methyltransferase, partial [Smithella sp.]